MMLAIAIVACFSFVSGVIWDLYSRVVKYPIYRLGSIVVLLLSWWEISIVAFIIFAAASIAWVILVTLLLPIADREVPYFDDDPHLGI